MFPFFQDSLATVAAIRFTMNSQQPKAMLSFTKNRRKITFDNYIHVNKSKNTQKNNKKTERQESRQKRTLVCLLSCSICFLALTYVIMNELAQIVTKIIVSSCSLP